MRTYTSVFIRAVGVVLLMVMSYLVFNWGVADYYDYQAETLIDSWRKGAPIKETWSEANNYVDRGLRFDKHNPSLLRQKALLIRVRMLTAELSIEEQINLGAEAKVWLNKALFIRPEYSLNWIDFAYIKWLVSEIDEEFRYALFKSVELGPWEPNAIEIISFIGLRNFGSYDEEIQRLVVANVVRGLRSPVNGLYEATLTRVEATPWLKSLIIKELAPHLAANPWPRSTRYNFHKLADWAWEDLGEQERFPVVNNAMSVIRTLNPQYSWIRITQNNSFGGELCSIALQESPEDENLKVWCAKHEET